MQPSNPEFDDHWLAANSKFAMSGSELLTCRTKMARTEARHIDPQKSYKTNKPCHTPTSLGRIYIPDGKCQVC